MLWNHWLTSFLPSFHVGERYICQWPGLTIMTVYLSLCCIFNLIWELRYSYFMKKKSLGWFSFLLNPQMWYSKLKIHTSLVNTRGSFWLKRPQIKKIRLKMNGECPSLLSPAGSPGAIYCKWVKRAIPQAGHDCPPTGKSIHNVHISDVSCVEHLSF